MPPDGDITLYPVGSCFDPQPKSRMHGGVGSKGARINLLKRRISALPDNDHIATLVPLG
jgi:hypothetical protein